MVGPVVVPVARGKRSRAGSAEAGSVYETGAVELGVPEFLDRHMQTPYAAGDIWYMQGPFVEAAPEFGYQGRLPLRDILRVGIAAVDAHCEQIFGGNAMALYGLA